MTKIILDRMALDDVGTNPVSIAKAIHKQLKLNCSAIPLVDVALALDIDEIRCELLTNFEGALITTPERGYGKILINSNSYKTRQRFTIAHELGHFLIQTHIPTSNSGFECNANDMSTLSAENNDLHARQEMEANRFAIELLTPENKLHPYSRATPDTKLITKMANEFEVSTQATARRLVQVHLQPLAAIFSKDGIMSYCIKHDEFPAIHFKRGDKLPKLFAQNEMRHANPEDWVYRSYKNRTLKMQTLIQKDAHAITLLWSQIENEYVEPDVYEDDRYRFR